MTLLILGTIDQNSKPKNMATYLKPFHRDMYFKDLNKDKPKTHFRDEGKWRKPRVIKGNEVKEVQTILSKAGFLHKNDIDGVYGYRTRASVRLFQEYIRTIENKSELGTPDGMVGLTTLKHLHRWRDNDLKCDWGQYTADNPSKEFSFWINALKNIKERFMESPPKIIDMVNKYRKSSDTLKVKDWSHDPHDVHLIGIRRNQNLRANAKRENDDIFILLIDGLVFKLWGSTDPDTALVKRANIKHAAWLAEGQHKYRIGWHKITNVIKIYMALKPLSNGVLIFRDVKNANALTEEDINEGLKGPNNSINIHWSGVGKSNFSAGCQVIAGQSYINHRKEVVDCSKYAASSYNDLGKTGSGSYARKTKGAYNVVADLVSVYRNNSNNTIHYTLGREEHFNELLGPDAAKNLLESMRESNK